MNVRHDSRTWIRKVDGDLHILPPEQQPKERWYRVRARTVWASAVHRETSERQGDGALAHAHAS